MSAAALERFPLTDLPTPVRRLAALERHLGRGSLWVKCDDRSGLDYGGNKPRKMEYLLARALRRGRSGMLTTGGIGTHHGLVTAIAARRAGLRAVLVLLPQPVTAHVRESLLLAHGYGAELHLAHSLAGAVARVSTLLTAAALRGRPLALIPTGGTSALGAVGFVRAGLELAAQVEAGELPEPDAIFVALGSGGTAAGLLAGLRQAGLRTRVVAVLVTDILPPSARRLAALANASLAVLRGAGEAVPPLRLAPADIEIDRAQLGQGYGAASAVGDEATRLARELEGIILEQTYTAKCFAAFLAAARAGTHGANLLFWNTHSSIDAGVGLARVPRPDELPAPFRRFFVERLPPSGGD